MAQYFFDDRLLFNEGDDLHHGLALWTNQGVHRTTRKVKIRGIRRSSIPKTRGIKVVKKEQGKTVEKTITVSEDQPVCSVNLRIEFDVDSCRLRPESFKLLNELGKALSGEALKERPVIIKGHTDSDGDDIYNLELSLERGLAVKSYITANFDISHSLLKVVGYGEHLPIVPNDSAANKQINRRVEITMDHGLASGHAK